MQHPHVTVETRRYFFFLATGLDLAFETTLGFALGAALALDFTGGLALAFSGFLKAGAGLVGLATAFSATTGLAATVFAATVLAGGRPLQKTQGRSIRYSVSGQEDQNHKSNGSATRQNASFRHPQDRFSGGWPRL